MFDVSFEDAGNGWAVGQTHEIFHTTIGGVSWTNQSDGGATRHAQDAGQGLILFDDEFTDGLQGRAVVENGRIILTENGGGLKRSIDDHRMGERSGLCPIRLFC